MQQLDNKCFVLSIFSTYTNSLKSMHVGFNKLFLPQPFRCTQGLFNHNQRGGIQLPNKAVQLEVEAATFSSAVLLN